MAGCNVYWSLAIISCEIRTCARFEQHERTPVAIRDPRSYVKRRLSKLSTSDVHLSTVTQKSLDDGRLCAFNSYV